MRYLILLPLAILLALSAFKSDRDRMAEIVEEWQGREKEIKVDTYEPINNQYMSFFSGAAVTNCK